MAKKRKQKSAVELPAPPSNRCQTGCPSAGRLAMVLGIMTAAVFCIYANTLQNPFVLDDLSNILHNPHIRLEHPGLDEIREAGFASPLPNRPVANISFALNYYFQGFDVAGFHIFNILVHVAAGILLYFLIESILKSPALQRRSPTYPWIAFCTALIWLVHPLQTQSVTYVVQRMNSLAAMFYLLALLLYAAARQAARNKTRWILLASCAIAGLLAVGSKEIAATLPITIFLYELYFQRDLSRRWLKRQMLPITGAVVLVAVVALCYLGVHPLDRILNSYASRDFTLMQRVLTEFRVVIYYISLLLWPHPSRLNLDHYFPVSHSLVEPMTTLPAIGGLAGLLVLAMWTAKKHRLISFCILWYLVNLLIESSVIGLEIIFEHRNYLPSMFFVLLVVAIGHRCIRPYWLKAAVLVATVLTLGIWTFQRNNVWRDEISLWQDCAAKSPQKARPHNNLAVALVRQGYIREAVIQYRRALQIKPDYGEAHFNLATALRRQGKLDDAVYHYQEMLRVRPDHSGTHNNLGAVLHEQGKIDEAIAHYAEALHLNPAYPGAHFNMGVALYAQGKTDQAIFHFREALRLDPGHSNAHYHLATALNHAGKQEEAASHFKAALDLKPDLAEAHYGLAATRYRQGRFQEAADHYSRALELKPAYAEAHNDLGVLLYHQGRLREAVVHYTQALDIKPEYAEAHNNLGAVLDDLGRTEEGIYHYREALRLKPDYAEAHNNLGVALAIRGQLNEALAHFGEALRISPDDLEALSNQANALASLGRYREATRHYQAALKINPDDAEVRRNLEKVLKQLGK